MAALSIPTADNPSEGRVETKSCTFIPPERSLARSSSQRSWGRRNESEGDEVAQ